MATIELLLELPELLSIGKIFKLFYFLCAMPCDVRDSYYLLAQVGKFLMFFLTGKFIQAKQLTNIFHSNFN